MAQSVGFYFIIVTFISSITSSIVAGTNQEHNEFIIKDYVHSLQGHRFAYEFFEYIKNHNESLTTTNWDRSRPVLDDLKCVTQLNEISNNIENRTIWALRIIDAWGSIPSGVLVGNLYDMGNYDECIRVNREISTNNVIEGKYCTAGIPVGNLTPLPNFIKLKIATCIPAVCNASYVDVLLKEFLNNSFNLTFDESVTLINENKCVEKYGDEPLSGVAIAVIVILSVMGAGIVFGTLNDYYYTSKEKKLHPLVKAFSIRFNARQLFRIVDYSNNPNVIPCLNGIRGFSLVWVLFCHDLIFQIVRPNINAVDVMTFFETPYSMLISQGFFSVESFFFIAALLLALVVFRQMDRSSGKLNIPMMYLHRYLRMTPVAGFGILLYLCTKYLGDGPLWKSLGYSHYEVCKQNWWVNLLYVQNYVRVDEICLPQTWYVAVDMQLYIISPLALFAMYKWGKKGVLGTFVVMLLMWACLFSTIYIHEYSMFYKKVLSIQESFKHIYFPTHVHTSSWIIGLMFGYYLHITKGQKVKLSKFKILLGWILCLGIMFTCLFCLFPKSQLSATPLTKLEEASFISFSRIAWPLSLCWIVYADINGYGGPVSSILGSPLWQPLARISFCLYIFHFMIITMNAGLKRTPGYFSAYEYMLQFWSDFGFTILLSIFIYLVIEAPLAGVEQYFISGRRQARPVESKKSNDKEVVQPEINQITNGLTSITSKPTNYA